MGASDVVLRGLTQTEAGMMVGGSQADVSRIGRGRLGSCSTDRLLTFLTCLDPDVEIAIGKSG